jgi:hypothetical protein
MWRSSEYIRPLRCCLLVATDEEETNTMKKALVLSAFLTALFPLSVLAQERTLVTFEGGIGVMPVSSGVGAGPTANAVNLNIVRGVSPPGLPWVISALKATVKTSGHIRVAGRGLLLAGGDPIGSTAGLSVFATLICEPTAPFTQHSTSPAGVPLEPDGDFLISDVLTPPPPASCVSPVLLIRVAGGNAPWFAAGIPRRE